MPEYSYFTTDLRSNDVLDELPLAGVQFTDELGEPGELTAQIGLAGLLTDVPPFGADGLTWSQRQARRVRSIRDATQVGRTAIWAERDGAIQWGGVLWKRDKSPGKLDLVAAGFLSYYARQRIATTASFLGVEQFEIVRQIFAAVAAKPGGDIGLLLPAGASGRLRDRTYEGIDRKQVLEAVQQLSEVIDGFDLAIIAEYDTAGLPSKRLALGYPRLGRAAAATDLVLEFPGNVETYRWPEEGDRIITTGYVRGEGEGAATPSATATNTALITSGYPSLEDEVVAPGVTEQDNLDGKAAALVAAYGGPVILPEFTLSKERDGEGRDALNSYAPGDEFLVELTDPEWWPADEESGGPGYTGTMRLVRRTVKPDPDGGPEDVTLVMSPFLGAA